MDFYCEFLGDLKRVNLVNSMYIIYYVYNGQAQLIRIVAFPSVLSLSVNSTGMTCALGLEPALEEDALYAFHQRSRSDIR